MDVGQRAGAGDQAPDLVPDIVACDVIVFRHAPSGYPFLWEGQGQPGGRWNRDGEGPTHYFAGTPDGAWAEFVRHEEITDPEDLLGVARAMWAVEIGEPPAAQPGLDARVLIGDPDSYPACREVAAAIRAGGEPGLTAPSAALLDAGGLRVEGGLQPGPAREATVVVLFGARPDLVGWRTAIGRPSRELLGRVRQFGARPSGEPGRTA
jgi:hypothetical protein